LDDPNAAEQNHWSERGRATSVGNSDALGRPRRSVRSLGHFTAIMNKYLAIMSHQDSLHLDWMGVELIRHLKELPGRKVVRLVPHLVFFESEGQPSHIYTEAATCLDRFRGQLLLVQVSFPTGQFGPEIRDFFLE
jgi:hypothetical protein